MTDVYVPQPGEVVLRLGDVVSYEWCGENVGIVIASPDWCADPVGGAYDADGYVWVSHPEYPKGVCKPARDVRPLRSAIDVECPNDQCGAKSGDGCRCCVCQAPIPCQHVSLRMCPDRAGLFRKLTGQAPKDSRRPGLHEPVVGASGASTSLGHPAQGLEKGTGRAAGPHAGEGERSKDACRTSSPAAPSGFRAPTDVYDVDCEACGAKRARSHTAVLTAAFCREDGRRVEPNALRVAAFEARGVRRVETGFIPKFRKCAGTVDTDGKRCGAEVMRQGIQLCGDCLASHDIAHSDRSRRGKGILRTELDRPLPPAALKTWPEHWETPGWES